MLARIPRTIPPTYRSTTPRYAPPFARFVLFLELGFRGCRGCYEARQEGYWKDQLDHFPGSLSRENLRIGSYD